MSNRVFAIWHEPQTAPPEPIGSKNVIWLVYTLVEGKEWKLYTIYPSIYHHPTIPNYRHPKIAETKPRKTQFKVPASAKIISVPAKWSIFVGVPWGGIDIAQSETWHWTINPDRAWLVHAPSGLSLCMIYRGEETAPQEVKAAWAAMMIAS